MKIFKRLSIFAVLGVVLMLLGSCDQWIDITVYVENYSASAVNAYITYEDGGGTGMQSIPAGGFRSFPVSFYDADKYGRITVTVIDGFFTFSTTGNVAENDWLLTVRYNGGGNFQYF